MISEFIQPILAFSGLTFLELIGLAFLIIFIFRG